MLHTCPQQSVFTRYPRDAQLHFLAVAYPFFSFRSFVCGPTVYADAHLGHARTFLTYDLLKRLWSRKNFTNTCDHAFGKAFSIRDAMSITDVDDKIINKSFAEGLCFQEISSLYERRFLEDMNALNVALLHRALSKVEFFNLWI